MHIECSLPGWTRQLQLATLHIDKASPCTTFQASRYSIVVFDQLASPENEMHATVREDRPAQLVNLRTR